MASNAEEKQAAIATAITSLSDHMSDMSQALQVQNMEVLSGFVNDSLKDSVTAGVGLSQSSSNEQRQATPSNATIQVLSEEIDQYNKALLSLSNAVLALSDAQTTSVGSSNENADMTEKNFDKLLDNSITANAKLDEIISSAHQVNVSGISNRLHAIENYLKRLTTSSSDSVPVIADNEPSSNWRMGLKDMAIWGFVMYGVYAIISV